MQSKITITLDSEVLNEIINIIEKYDKNGDVDIDVCIDVLEYILMQAKKQTGGNINK